MMSDQAPVKTEETTETEIVTPSQPSSSETPVGLEIVGEETQEAQDLEMSSTASSDETTETTPPEVEATPESTEEVATEDSLTIDSLRVGQRLVGKVKNITDFGAFVDVGIPQDGLVHISKLAKWKVEKVTDVVSQGEEVEVWVKKVDKKRGRLSLTMIRPISLRLREIKEEAELEGVITRLESYGAFVDIGSEREGLVHISQISHDYIKHPEEALAINDEVKVRVLKVDRKKRQVDLSIKALLPPPQQEVKEEVEEKVKEEQVEEVRQEEAGEEEPALTAMAIAYTALQSKQQPDRETKKSAPKEKRQQSREMDAIVTRTLAGRE
jgi:transcriptional accessory protein Tex/SPT6